MMGTAVGAAAESRIPLLHQADVLLFGLRHWMAVSRQEIDQRHLCREKRDGNGLRLLCCIRVNRATPPDGSPAFARFG